MKNNKFLLLLVIFVFFIQCRENRKDTKSKILIKKEVKKKRSQKTFLVDGIYFPDQYNEDCDFWIKIHLKNSKEYLYTFFNGSKVKKTGKLSLIDNDESKQLIFDNAFKCIYSRDTIFIQNYGNSTNYYERISYCSLKFISLVKKLKIENTNLTFYNDKAYYLEQSGLYTEAIYLLERIIKQYPNRTVAYINLGDSYWGVGSFEKAKKTYQIYVKQMQKKGKEVIIPKRVLERIVK
ncbi:tetratricopeptide repeat protein [Tenacibaculum maritimum]|uniref:Uncharacterized protein n=4 Tax=Tenacibaculum maritimum TaxID=107401 RepID=A0A2H1EAZ7_9FLAO|nr:tetratricopeptide repeat protein [Tenacibaculum maritimum]MCD9564244.1 tetratricopeptide repeat protein [Tenacibaculum maritimum]MCD9566429.1 tetratricopeptide repeat protein [Tenacibaculum maritimum]MCD9580297.1 tetratricopeptide repeat protein [Tenacibaculum maritimum]MCD9586217.1 tetratricopeptide repeat protein [Tenacibaculum maritimum]MCD9597131.1 tetratricopeptide repeat protein [Tenacibaculum maritimum]